MRQVRARLTGPENGTWTATVPDVGQVTTDNPGLADFEVRRLIARQLGLHATEVDDLEVLLVDADDRTVYPFDLLFTGRAGPDPGDAETRYAALAADPPAGCRFEDLGDFPALHCLRRGANRFQAISSTVAEIRERYGLEANDLGFEKLWEWAGSREWREEMIAHLLLMAAERARWTGVPAEHLVSFIRTAMSGPPEV